MELTENILFTFLKVMMIKKFPLMFNFHGGAGYANDFMYTNDMRPIADTADFIAVYPQGAIILEDGGHFMDSQSTNRSR